MDLRWLNKGLIFLATGAMVGLLVAGCGGGGGGSDVGGGGGGGGGSSVISGTAATGAPIVGQVVAVDKNGQSFTATTSADGAYTVNVAGGTPPFILTIMGTSGGKTVTLNSVATAVDQTVNITPLTDLIVSAAAGQPAGAVLASLCTSIVTADKTACNTALTNATSGTKLADAVATVKAMIAPLNTGNVDPLNGSFAANGAGMDAVLDSILVKPALAQGAMATITLIAVPTAELGNMTLPTTTGGTNGSTATTDPATLTAAIAQADIATTALSEIKACMASFNALYPANMTTAPAYAAVEPFIAVPLLNTDPNYQQAIDFVTQLSTLPPAGYAFAGLRFTPGGFAPFDMSPQANAAAIDQTKPALEVDPVSGAPVAAWVRLNATGETMNWKMIKGAAYTGCPGGWKLAGYGDRIYAHMNARVSKWNLGSVGYKRELPMHVQTAEVIAAGIGSIEVNGPGLKVYGGVATPVTLTIPVADPVTGIQFEAMAIQGFGYNTESIESCQDMAAAGSTATGTPCYDDTVVAPGAIFTYTVKDMANAVMYAYPFEVHAVPLSMAFVKANDKDLFAQNLAATPLSTVNAASVAVGSPLDNIITFNYTVSSVYGALAEHCRIGLNDAGGTMILSAEQHANGQQTSCTFTTAGLNSGSLIKPVSTFASGHMTVATQVLGNMATTFQSYSSGASGGGGSGGGGTPTTDTTVPTVPSAVVATAAIPIVRQVNLTWNASSDNVGVAGYQVYSAGALVGTSATTSFSATNLLDGMQYCYTVRAYDAAGNASADSASACATTSAPAMTATEQAIQSQFTVFQGLFATTIPSAVDPTLLALFDASFSDWGTDKIGFIAMLTSPNGIPVGSTMTNVVAVAPRTLPAPAAQIPNDATHQWFTFAFTVPGQPSELNGPWLVIYDGVSNKWLVAGSQMSAPSFNGSYTSSTLMADWTHVETNTVSGTTVTGDHTYTSTLNSIVGKFLWTATLMVDPSNNMHATISGTATLDNYFGDPTQSNARTVPLTGDLWVNNDGSINMNWSAMDPLTSTPVGGSSFRPAM